MFCGEIATFIPVDVDLELDGDGEWAVGMREELVEKAERRRRSRGE